MRKSISTIVAMLTLPVMTALPADADGGEKSGSFVCTGRASLL